MCNAFWEVLIPQMWSLSFSMAMAIPNSLWHMLIRKRKSQVYSGPSTKRVWLSMDRTAALALSISLSPAVVRSSFIVSSASC